VYVDERTVSISTVNRFKVQNYAGKYFILLSLCIQLYNETLLSSATKLVTEFSGADPSKCLHSISSVSFCSVTNFLQPKLAVSKLSNLKKTSFSRDA
jgi:hypothetical protein